jgi:hypothetical protein
VYSRMDGVHGPGSRVHGIGTYIGSSNPRSTIQILCSEMVSTHLISTVWARSDRGAVGSGRGCVDSRSWWRTMAERGGSPEFGFSRAMAVGFRWGLLLWDISYEGNSIRLTLIGGGRQQSPATVRWLGWLQASTCAAFNGVPTLRIGGKPS